MIAVNSSVSPLPPTFHVVNTGASRADLARRTELKFTLLSADVAKLRRVLAGNGRQQVYNRKVSHVYSVYFDDSRLSACQANLDGLGRRKKVRLRWYDSPSPGQDFYFEIKWRENRVTGKHRLQLRTNEPLARLSYATILSNLTNALPEPYQPLLARYCEPTVLVRYDREHFTSADGTLRATIDYHVTYFDQTGKQFISTSFGQPHEGLVVLEGKTPVGRQHELRSLLHPLGARVGRCSKYVYGCLALGLARQ